MIRKRPKSHYLVCVLYRFRGLSLNAQFRRGHNELTRPPSAETTTTTILMGMKWIYSRVLISARNRIIDGFNWRSNVYPKRCLADLVIQFRYSERQRCGGGWWHCSCVRSVSIQSRDANMIFLWVMDDWNQINHLELFLNVS